MAKRRKGYDAQDAVIARFKRDVKGSNKNSAVAQCIKEGKKLKKVADVEVDEDGEEIRFSFKFLSTGI
jgi:hypothetical protein|tara:strand:- start:1513 stop:1716 length:204 start_codon:yes stop_codon:yes gene_type:complete